MAAMKINLTKKHVHYFSTQKFVVHVRKFHGTCSSFSRCVLHIHSPSTAADDVIASSTTPTMTSARHTHTRGLPCITRRHVH